MRQNTICAYFFIGRDLSCTKNKEENPSENNKKIFEKGKNHLRENSISAQWENRGI